jgi:surfeit locus 1 family protein
MLRLVAPTIAAIAIAITAVSLGNWQTRRAEEKELLKATLAQAKALPPISFQDVSKETHEKRRVTLTGVFLSDKTIFIDNRTHKGQAGFHVLTPLKIDNGTVLVLRGWVARDIRDRTKLPTLKALSEPVAVTGLSQEDLIKSYELGKAEEPALGQQLWQSATLEQVRQFTKLSLAPFVLRQTDALGQVSERVSSQSNNGQSNGQSNKGQSDAVQEVNDGLVRDWAAFNTDVDKHRGYAVQWYSLAGLSLVLWVWFVVIKRSKKKAK